MRNLLFVPCLALLSTAAMGQAPSTASTTPAATGATLPAAPAGVLYRYWPRQIVQWVGPELPYSMIDADVDDRGSQVLYDVSLTDRATAKRVHYTNLASEAALDKALGLEVYLVQIALDPAPEAVKGATYVLRFATEKGVPVVWQFVLGTDITEQGSGMNPIDRPTPILLYREQGALAGEGTALKVGAVTSTADVWSEISHPPYFVAYRGALSSGVHELVFVPRTVDWKIAPAAASVAPGADWTMTTAAGASHSVHVDAVQNGEATLRETNALVGTEIVLQARQTATGWALERARYQPVNGKLEHSVSMNFVPPLESGITAKVEIVAGKKTRLAGGTVTMSQGAAETWTLTQPAWAHKEPVTATATQSR